MHAILFKQSALAELDSILAELVISSMVGIDEELPFKSHTVFQKVLVSAWFKF